MSLITRRLLLVYIFINYLQVSDNGYIIFGVATNFFNPVMFPLSNRVPIIAPFLADVDLRCSIGQIFYRQTTSSSIRGQAGRDITDLLFLSSAFSPSIVFIATWQGVEYYNCRNHQVNMDLHCVNSNSLSYDVTTCML